MLHRTNLIDFCSKSRSFRSMSLGFSFHKVQNVFLTPHSIELNVLPTDPALVLGLVWISGEVYEVAGPSR